MNTTNTQDPIKLALVKLNAALMCHPNAVETLIEEAIELLQPASAQPKGDAREAFEAWARTEGWPHHSEDKDGTHRYSGQSWAAWQAASTQGFTAHDMATAAAGGFRDGVASTQASEPSAAPARAVEPLTDDEIFEIAESDESNPDDRGWGPKFSTLAFTRLAIDAFCRKNGIPATIPTQAAQGGEA